VAGGAVLGSAASGWAPQDAADPPAEALFRIRGHGLSLASPTFRKGIQPVPGERILVQGELTTAADQPIGRFYAVYMALAAPSSNSTAAASLEQHTFDFGDGTLVGSGLGTRALDSADAFAVVGGTGRYLGARGSYSAIQRHLELGGDGTAEFLISLTA
jgi:hypothetical protein